MSQFFKKFLTEEGSRLNPESGQYLALGAFGKHPGWDDHIEDLGLETETLTLAKRILYVQGVGGQIDTGAWEKLESAQRIEGFNHVFVWQRSGQFLLGRLWSSSDGKGRTRYPMVLCVHCIGASLRWGLEHILPRLQELEQACKDASSAAAVRALLDSARFRLRALLVHAEKETEFTPSVAQALQRFVANPAFGPDQQGWFRILYQVQNQMAVFGQGSFNPKGDLTALRPQLIRLPVGADTPEQALLLWRRFLSARIDRSVPVFMALPAGESWLDAILGEPSSSEFFCLRARPSILPFATEVPYELNEDFKVKARNLLADFQSGKTTIAPAQASPEEGASGGWISVTQRWFKSKGSKLWLVLAVGVALLAGAGFWIFSAAPGKPPVGDLAKASGSAASPSPATPVFPKETAPTAKLVTQADQSTQQTAQAATAGEAEAKRLAAEREMQEKAQAAAALESARRQAEADAREKARQVAAAVDMKPPAEPLPSNQPPPVQIVAAPSVPASNSNPPATGSAKPATALRQVFTNTIGMVLVWIAALPGTAEGGYVGKYEVTQQQYEQVMGSNPSQSRNALQPVESVTWQEAVEFCHKLNALEKATGASIFPLAYSLPTELQWEFLLGDAKFEDAVTSRTTIQKAPAAVGSLAPNRFGLFDVLGNVWEFCADESGGAERVLKGAGFNNRKLFTEKAGQWRPLERTTPRHLGPQERASDAGFRCVALWQP